MSTGGFQNPLSRVFGILDQSDPTMPDSYGSPQIPNAPGANPLANVFGILDATDDPMSPPPAMPAAPAEMPSAAPQMAMPSEIPGIDEAAANRRAMIEKFAAEGVSGSIPDGDYLRDHKGALLLDPFTKQPQQKRITLTPEERLHAAKTYYQSKIGQGNVGGVEGALWYVKGAPAIGGIATAADIARTVAANKAIEHDIANGTNKATDEDYLQVGRAIAANEEAQRPQGFMQQVGEGVYGSASMAADMLLSGGVAAAGKKAAAKTAKEIGQAIAEKTASRTMGGLARRGIMAAEGEAFRLATPNMLSRAVANSMQRGTDKLNTTDDGAIGVTKQDGESAFSAIMKGFGEQYAEQLGERSGAGMRHVAKILSKTKLAQAIADATIGNVASKALGSLSNKAVSRVLRRAELDGFFPEMIEEFNTELIKTPIIGPNGVTGLLSQGRYEDAAKQLGVMAATVGITMGGAKAGGAAISATGNAIQAHNLEQREGQLRTEMAGGDLRQRQSPVTGNFSLKRIMDAAPQEVAAFTASAEPSRSAMESSGLRAKLRELDLYDHASNADGRRQLWDRLKQFTASPEDAAQAVPNRMHSAMERYGSSPLTSVERATSSVTLDEQGWPVLAFEVPSWPQGDRTLSIRQGRSGWTLELPGGAQQPFARFDQAMDAARGALGGTPLKINKPYADGVKSYMEDFAKAKRSGMKGPPVPQELKMPTVDAVEWPESELPLPEQETAPADAIGVPSPPVETTPAPASRRPAPVRIENGTPEEHAEFFGKTPTPVTALSERQQQAQRNLEAFGAKVRWFHDHDDSPAISSRRLGVVYLNAAHMTDDVDTAAFSQVIGDEVAHVSGVDAMTDLLSAKELQRRRESYLAQAPAGHKARLLADSGLLDREAVADYVAEFWRSNSFRAELFNENPSLWNRIVDAVLRLFGRNSSRYARLPESQRKVIDALRAKMTGPAIASRTPATSTTNRVPQSQSQPTAAGSQENLPDAKPASPPKSPSRPSEGKRLTPPSIERIEDDPVVRMHYDAPAGVSEGYTVGEHSLEVLRNFDEQADREAIDAIGRKYDIRAYDTIRAAVALHDIGKGRAVKDGKKSLQHRYTIPILRQVMKGRMFTGKEIDAAAALVGNDAIGLAIQEKLAPQKAAEVIRAASAKAGMSPQDYFDLQSMYYKSDAASYPSLRSSLFATQGDKLKIAKEPYGILEELIHGQVRETPWVGRGGANGRVEPVGGGGNRGAGEFVHGTAIKFDRFSEEFDSGKNRVGPGAYLLDEKDADVAEHYSARAYKRLLSLFTPKTRATLENADAAKLESLAEMARQRSEAARLDGDEKNAGRWAQAEQIVSAMRDGRLGKHVLSAEFSPKKILDMGADESGGRLLTEQEASVIRGAAPDAAMPDTRRAFALYDAAAAAVGKARVNEAIKAAGYDAIHFVHKKGGYSRPYSVFTALSHSDAVPVASRKARRGISRNVEEQPESTTPASVVEQPQAKEQSDAPRQEEGREGRAGLLAPVAEKQAEPPPVSTPSDAGGGKTAPQSTGRKVTNPKVGDRVTYVDLWDDQRKPGTITRVTSSGRVWIDDGVDPLLKSANTRLLDLEYADDAAPSGEVSVAAPAVRGVDKPHEQPPVAAESPVDPPVVRGVEKPVAASPDVEPEKSSPIQPKEQSDERRDGEPGRGPQEQGAGAVVGDRPPFSESDQAGSSGALITADGKARQIRYRVVEADEITPSHDARRSFTRNEAGDENERPYHDPKQGAASRQVVIDISKAEPEKLSMLVSDTTTPIDGPPVTDDTGVVLGGNARSMGMQLAYHIGGDAALRLKRAMVGAASKFGIDSTVVEGMASPIIIRVIDEPGERGELSALLNESLAAAKSQATIAVSQGKRVSPETAAKISAMLEPRGGEDVPSLRDILSQPAKAEKIVQSLRQDGAWSEREVDLYTDPNTGLVNDDGKSAIEKLLVGKLIADPSIVGDAAPAVRQKLIAAIGPLVRGSSDKTHGSRFTQVIKDAVQAFAGYKAESLPLERYFMQQKALFDVPGLGDYSVAGMVYALDEMGPLKFKKTMDNVVRALGIKSVTPTKSMFAEMDETVDTLEEAIEREINPPLAMPGKTSKKDRSSDFSRGARLSTRSTPRGVVRISEDSAAGTATANAILKPQVPATWATDAPKGDYAKQLAAKMDEEATDPTPSIGPAHIMRFLGDRLHASLHYVNSQLPGRRGVFKRINAVIFGRSPWEAAVTIHELGHALSRMTADKSGISANVTEWHATELATHSLAKDGITKPSKKQIKDRASELGDMLLQLTDPELTPDGVSMASAATTEEGMGEFVRRYVMRHDTLDSFGELRPTIESYLETKAPDVLEALQDAHRLWVKLEARPTGDRAALAVTERLPPPETSARVSQVARKAAVAIVGPSAGEKMRGITIYSATKKGAEKAGVNDPVSVARAVRQRFGYDTARGYSGRMDAAFGVWAQAQSLVPSEEKYALTTHIRVALQKKATPFRVVPDSTDDWSSADRNAASSTGVITESQLARFEALGVYVPLEAVKPGDYVKLSQNGLREMFDDLKQKGTYDKFDAYRALRTSLYRHKQAADKADLDWASDVAAVQRLHPYPGIDTLLKPTDVEAWLRETEREHPEFKQHYDTQQQFLRQLLMIDILSGERSAEEVLRMMEAHTEYSHIPRRILNDHDLDGFSAAVSGGLDISSGVKRARGSELPYLPMIEAMVRRASNALSSYYEMATIRSGLAMLDELDKPINVDGKQVMLDYGLRKFIQRQMVKVAPDPVVVATLLKSDAAVQKIQEYMAQKIGEALGEDINPAELDLDLDDFSPTPVMRVKRPKMPNVLGYFDPAEPGVRKYVFVPDPATWMTLTYLGGVDSNWLSAVSKLARAADEPMRKHVTNTLGFVFNNFIRDPMSFAMFSESVKEGLTPMIAAVAAFRRAMKPKLGMTGVMKGDMTEAWEDAAVIGKMLTNDITPDTTTAKGRFVEHAFGSWSKWSADDPVLRRVAIVTKNLSQAGLQGPLLFSGLMAATGIPVAGESLHRVGAKVLAKERGASDLEAQLAFAKATGFFAQRGASRTARDITAGAMFLNPAMQGAWQGMENLLELGGDPRKAALLALKTTILFGAGAAAAYVAASLLEIMPGSDEEKRQLLINANERSESDRLRRAWFPVYTPWGGTELVASKAGGGPLGVAFHYGFDTAMSKMTEGGRPVGLGARAKRVWEEIPYGTPYDVIPRTANIMRQFVANYEDFRDQPIEPDWMRREYPDHPEFRTTDRDPGLTKLVSESLAATGLPAMVRPSPVRLRFLAEQAGGSDSIILMEWADYLSGKTKQRPRIPLASGLLLGDYTGRYGQSARDVYDDAQKAESARNAAYLAIEKQQDPTPYWLELKELGGALAAQAVIEDKWKRVTAEMGKPNSDEEEIRRLKLNITETAIDYRLNPEKWRKAFIAGELAKQAKYPTWRASDERREKMRIERERLQSKQRVLKAP